MKSLKERIEEEAENRSGRWALSPRAEFYKGANFGVKLGFELAIEWIKCLNFLIESGLGDEVSNDMRQEGILPPGDEKEGGE